MKKLEDIKKVAVIGAGTMGPGIAQSYALAGYRVTMNDMSEKALETAQSVLHTSLETYAGQGEIAGNEVEEIFSRVSFTPDQNKALQDADVVVECIVEKAEAKKALFEAIDAALPEDSYILSNTSYLNIFELLPERRLPYAVITHWYAPPQLIPLVEVVGSTEASDETVGIVMQMLKMGRKRPVRLKRFISGYIVNRLQMALAQETYNLIDNGYCEPEDIDMAVRTSIIPRALVLGLCQRADFTGLDASLNGFRTKRYHLPEQNDEPKALVERVERGDLGVKTGKGFCDYTGHKLEDVLAKRDAQLFEAFRLANKLLADPIP